MTGIKNISAVIFDMDGTLVDSEPYTALAVAALCRECDLYDAEVNCSEFDGVSWENIARLVAEQVPQLVGKSGIPGRLHELYHELLKNKPPPQIKMARETVIAARAQVPTAIVSSSFRESIAETIDRMAIGDFISFYAGIDDYENAKPAPDGYLKVADSLQVDARQCLVFEDSLTGLQAARNAGMQVVAITQASPDLDRVRALSDRLIYDFSELPVDFFSHITSTKVPA